MTQSIHNIINNLLNSKLPCCRLLCHIFLFSDHLECYFSNYIRGRRVIKLCHMLFQTNWIQVTELKKLIYFILSLTISKSWSFKYVLRPEANVEKNCTGSQVSPLLTYFKATFESNQVTFHKLLSKSYGILMLWFNTKIDVFSS